MDASYEKRYYRSTVVRCELDLCLQLGDRFRHFQKEEGADCYWKGTWR